MVEGLAECSTIESVHITASGVAGHLGQLSRLQSLASLTTRSASHYLSASQLPGSLMDALQPLTKITKLVVLGHSLLWQPVCSWLPVSLVELTIERGEWAPPCLLPHLRNLPALRTLSLGDPGTRLTSFWGPGASQQLSTLSQLTALSISALNSPPPGFVRNLSGLTALRALRVVVSVARDIPDHPFTFSNVTDADLLHLAPLAQHLTRLDLGSLADTSATGVATLLGALTNLQHLELKWPWWAPSMCSGRDGQALVQGLLPLLAHLTSLRCEGVELLQPSRDVLLVAAAAHDCRCELKVLGCSFSMWQESRE